MTIDYQFGDVDAHGATIRAQAASLEGEHQSVIRDVLARGLLGRRRIDGLPAVVTDPGRNFQVIYEHANTHGQKVQTTGGNMAGAETAVGSGWA